ncbi:MAG: hypothetical protein R2697_00745 [Ilumatobacteraceae bacterium]
MFGSGGAGKTTVLRTIAAEAERAGAVSIVFDFASRGLVSLRSLPSVIDVRDRRRSRAGRAPSWSSTATRRRRALLAASGAGLRLSTAAGGERLDRIVVLIDGFRLARRRPPRPAVVEVRPVTHGPTSVQRLVVDGRQVGLHVVFDRRPARRSRPGSSRRSERGWCSAMLTTVVHRPRRSRPTVPPASTRSTGGRCSTG